MATAWTSQEYSMPVVIFDNCSRLTDGRLLGRIMVDIEVVIHVIEGLTNRLYLHRVRPRIDVCLQGVALNLLAQE
jgi:hypothetical protein